MFTLKIYAEKFKKLQEKRPNLLKIEPSGSIFGRDIRPLSKKARSVCARAELHLGYLYSALKIAFIL